MPADVQPLGAGDQPADTTPLDGPEDARQHGRQRRGYPMPVVAFALVVLLAAATVGVLRLTLPDEPGGPTPTVQFTSLTPIGPGLPVSTGAPGAQVTVDGDVAFVADRTADRRLRIRALDLNTGRLAWSSEQLGNWEEGPWFLPVPDGLLVFVNNDSANHQETALYSLDPTTGGIRWQSEDVPLLPYSGQLPGQLVVVSPTEDRVRGLDARTGEVRWSSPMPAGSHFIPSSVWTAGGPNADTPETRLFRYDADGTLSLLDSRNGKLSTSWHGLLPRPGDDGSGGTISIVGNRLYKVHNGRPNTVDMVDLDSPAAGFTRFFTPQPNELFPQLSPCGPSTVCVATSFMDAGLSESGRLMLVDSATGAQRWEHPGGSWGAWALGDRIRTNGGRLFDLDGKLLYNPPETAAGGFVTEGSVLALVGGLVVGHKDVEVVGVSAVDGSARSLGRIPPLVAGCTFNTRVLVCVHADTVRAYRFAR